MADQLEFFEPTIRYPEGFAFRRDVITPETERGLLPEIRALPFQDFEFHGYLGKRRTVSFGGAYNFSRESLETTEPLPKFLLELREVAAEFADVAADQLNQTLVTEYGPGAGIGWHRDKGVFGIIVGISLLSGCTFRLRRQRGDEWERVSIDATPRSAYLLSGSARIDWEHSIPEVETTRYSVTFRTVR